MEETEQSGTSRYCVIIVSERLTTEQFLMLKKATEDFLEKNINLLNRVSLNKRIEGQL